MAVLQLFHSVQHYICASTDTKPTEATHGVKVGATLWEYDTSKLYITYDGTNWQEKVDMVSLVASSRSGKATPAVYNVTMTLADTEYSQALPANCKAFTIKCQDGTAFRMAYVTGKVATPVAPYKTMFAMTVKSEDNLYLASQTIYFACASAGKVIEIEAWS